MILIDTSIWIDHLRKPDNMLLKLLENNDVLCHPLVVGEIAVGTFRQRDRILKELVDLPATIAVSHAEALQFISRHALYGKGIGYIDVHLLASVRLTPRAKLWTRHKRLHDIADGLQLAFHPSN